MTESTPLPERHHQHIVKYNPDLPLPYKTDPPQETPREKWGEGVWLEEPDEWTYNDVTGYKCRILRHWEMGHLCGYVQIPKKHPLFEKIDKTEETIEAHGGLTFNRRGKPQALTDNEDEDRTDEHWIGFDCAHSGDLTPLSVKFFGRGPREHETYRTVEYVEAELRSVCRQLKSLDIQET